MQGTKVHDESGIQFELLDDEGTPIPEAEGFLRHLRARGCSPNTLSAYAHDLKHFFSFLQNMEIDYLEFSALDSLRFLEYLRAIRNRKTA